MPHRRSAGAVARQRRRECEIRAGNSNSIPSRVYDANRNHRCACFFDGCQPAAGCHVDLPIIGLRGLILHEVKLHRKMPTENVCGLMDLVLKNLLILFGHQAYALRQGQFVVESFCYVGELPRPRVLPHVAWRENLPAFTLEAGARTEGQPSYLFPEVHQIGDPYRPAGIPIGGLVNSPRPCTNLWRPASQPERSRFLRDFFGWWFRHEHVFDQVGAGKPDCNPCVLGKTVAFHHPGVLTHHAAHHVSCRGNSRRIFDQVAGLVPVGVKLPLPSLRLDLCSQQDILLRLACAGESKICQPQKPQKLNRSGRLHIGSRFTSL